MHTVDPEVFMSNNPTVKHSVSQESGRYYVIYSGNNHIRLSFKNLVFWPVTLNDGK